MLARSMTLLALAAALGGCFKFQPRPETSGGWGDRGYEEGNAGREANAAGVPAAERDTYMRRHQQGVRSYCGGKDRFDKPICRTAGLPAGRR